MTPSIPDRVSNAGPDSSSRCPACGESDAKVIACSKCDKLICADGDNGCSVSHGGKEYCAKCVQEIEEEARDFDDWIFEVNYITRHTPEDELDRRDLIAAARRALDRAEALA
jgi:hypothetical protein